MEHPVVTQAMEHPAVTQAIAVLEAIALPAQARVMTDHPAMETVGPPVVAMAVGTVVVMALGTVVAMAVGTVVAMAVGTVVAMALGTVVAMAVERSRPDDLVFKKLYGAP